jgi:hypothetical protein
VNGGWGFMVCWGSMFVVVVNQSRASSTSFAGFDVIYKSSTNRHDRKSQEDTRQGPFSHGLMTNLAGMSLAIVGPWILRLPSRQSCPIRHE